MTSRSRFLGFLFVLTLLSPIYGQGLERSLIGQNDVERHIRILASDEFQGRKTGEQGNNVAARYIAEQFRYYGIESPDVYAIDYLQQIPFTQIKSASSSNLVLGENELDPESDFIVRMSQADTFKYELTYLPMGEEITDKVKGKIVLTHLGNPDEGLREAVASSWLKSVALKEKGAKGLIEIYKGQYPWRMIKHFLGGTSLQIINENPGDDFPIVLIKPQVDSLMSRLKNGEKVDVVLECAGTESNPKPSSNVVGILPGTDPVLSKEYIVLSAHFDHVGVGNSNNVQSGDDYIFNGARDNAMGVTALLSAAKSLGANPPKRSVIFAAFTAEEIGLIGSRYFVEHPPVQLKQIVFNLNTDGAGYTDTTLVSVMGLDRVGVRDEIVRGCEAFGLSTFADPAPEQGLFDRSDNVSFAVAGVPAPTFSPGFKKFDQEIMKHYHRPSDEVESLSLSYVHKFSRAFSYTARLIADKQQRPQWIQGDKYEEAFKGLYGK